MIDTLSTPHCGLGHNGGDNRMRYETTEYEEVECRECETPFNIGAQWYYDDLCPECKAEADGEQATWPACIRCGEKYEPGTGEMVPIRNPSRPGGAERVVVCGDCA